ncbi:hypothetical protein [Cytophaga aurantiaca]|uniref:hypothetical protein n=1 Tax=Cytophaga aurantiaca TaxID=29530 RepID=UPI0003611FDF|nr:hypothetical protein [Cytophaga aurantiaca]
MSGIRKILGVIWGVLIVTFVSFLTMRNEFGMFRPTKLNDIEFINKNLNYKNIDAIKISTDIYLGYFSRTIINKDTINYLIRGIKNAKWSYVSHPSATDCIDIEIHFKNDTSATFSVFNSKKSGTNFNFWGLSGHYRNDTLQPIIKALSDELYKDTAIYSKRHHIKKYLNY